MSGQGPCVLVVEDEPSARDVIVEALEDDGCRALGAQDGADAIRVLRAQLGAKPCVILLDLMMPGMNGWKFREWLRTQPDLQGIPVVLLSAVRNLSDEAKKLGAAGWLEKPIGYDQLKNEVERHCGPCRRSA